MGSPRVLNYVENTVRPPLNIDWYHKRSSLRAQSVHFKPYTVIYLLCAQNVSLSKFVLIVTCPYFVKTHQHVRVDYLP